MLAPSLALVLLASVGLSEGRSIFDIHHRHVILNRKRQNDDSTSTVLAADAIQSGSFVDGSQAAGSAAGQAKSLTSKNNFINNCAGKTLTNGLQVQSGSCNGITMGDIPSKSNMVSSIITFPLHASTDLAAETTFSISVRMKNFVAGSFTNAKATYYAAPQTLQGGKVVGHTHVTVQDLGPTLNPKKPLDATQFVFFKGINDDGDGNGLLSAVVTGGLPAGNYRVCTMASSSNHQPVLMPVAQRGTPDDCTKFTVGQATGSGQGGNDDTSSSSAISIKATSAPETSTADVSATKASTVETSATESASVETSTAATTSGFASLPPFRNSTIANPKTKTRKGGKGGNGGNKGSFTMAAVSTKAAVTTTTSSVAETSVTTKANNNGGGKGGNDGKGATKTRGGKADSNSRTIAAAATTSSKQLGGGKAINTKGAGGRKHTVKIVHKVTVIETFFEFVLSLGGLPPSVGKKGNSFAVLDEIFDDLAGACAAACGHQYKTCISFSGPGFSFQECVSQRKSCGAAAVTATAKASTPAAITATVTVPPTATVTGSVISEETVSTTVLDIQTNAAQPTVAPVLDVATTDLAACSVVTSTVTVDAPIVSATLIPSSTPRFSNATATFSKPSSTSSAPATIVKDSAAIGGIVAPLVTDSGDASRPFLVNGNTFVNKAAAVQRSCDVQFNQCANAVNGGKLAGVSVGDCSKQKDRCGGA